MAYATTEDLRARYGEQTLRDLASDTGHPVVDLASNLRLKTALSAASGRLRAAVKVGQIYSDDDLTALIGDDLELLKDLVCELAMLRLMAARPEKFPSESIQAQKKELEEYLDMLRKGQRLFGGVDAAAEAGVAKVDGPSALDLENLNLITVRTNRFFPSFASRLPRGRGGY